MQYLRLIVIIACVLLSGCAEHLRQQYATKCASYGFTSGTTAYAQCMQIEDQRSDAALSNLAGSLQQLGQQMKPPPRINCTTNYIGTTAYTNCY